MQFGVSKWRAGFWQAVDRINATGDLVTGKIIQSFSDAQSRFRNAPPMEKAGMIGELAVTVASLSPGGVAARTGAAITFWVASRNIL